MSQATAAATPAAETRVNSFLAKVYLLMFVGLAITGVVSYFISEYTYFETRLATNPALVWALFIVQVIVVHVISARVMKVSAGAGVILFLFYAALTGVAISSIFLLYSDDAIYTVFIITSVTFLVTGAIGLLIKKDMSGSGHFLFMLLTGWFIAWLASWFFGWLFGVPLTNFNWALNFIGIAIFVALTAWDTNQLKKIGQQTEGSGGYVVIGALKLYLDYINLFLLLLRAANR